MLKNKKILLIILSFIFVLFFNTNSFAATLQDLLSYQSQFEHSVVFTRDGDTYVVGTDYLPFFYRNGQLYNDGGFSYNSDYPVTLYYLNDSNEIISASAASSSPYYISFDTIISSSHTINDFNTNEPFFR